MPQLDFNFYVSNIEDAILQALREPMQAIGVKGFEIFSGELEDPKKLQEALSSRIKSYPLVMVAYGEGVNVGDPPVSRFDGQPVPFRHDCYFQLIFADNNPQGLEKRRRGQLYPMIGIAHTVLTLLTLKAVVDGTTYELTTVPLMPGEVEYIARMPNMTAYGLAVYTAFKWQSVDRTEDAVPVNEFVLNLDNVSSGVPISNLPGVDYEVGG